jgi:hypothetical protein
MHKTHANYAIFCAVQNSVSAIRGCMRKCLNYRYPHDLAARANLNCTTRADRLFENNIFLTRIYYGWCVHRGDEPLLIRQNSWNQAFLKELHLYPQKARKSRNKIK